MSTLEPPPPPPPTTTTITLFRGRVIHAPTRGGIEILEDALVVVDPASGRIASVHESPTTTSPEALALWAATPPARRLELGPSEFLMPGFVDTHVHAPQYQYMGTATDVPLMTWLERYTFPVEGAFADLPFARAWYAKLLDRLLAEGITTAQYFATTHVPATLALVDLVAARGQRGLVGLVSMDQHAPGSYRSGSAREALADAEAFVQESLARGHELVRPVVTPRFIPTCSLELLRGLGELAARHGLRIQSHAAESHDEVAFVEALHGGRRDTEILRETGLLTPRSCMAHAVHLTDDELGVFAETGTSIAHCPLSNFFFANGLLDLPRCWARGVRVGLGTDIAGGYSASMLRGIQSAVLSSKALEMKPRSSTSSASSSSSSPAIDFKDAFWLATMGGAEALGLSAETGSFAPGKSFDAIVVDVTGPGNVDLAPRDTPLDVFQKLLHNGDSRNFTQVFVRGRRVHATSSLAK